MVFGVLLRLLLLCGSSAAGKKGDGGENLRNSGAESSQRALRRGGAILARHISAARRLQQNPPTAERSSAASRGTTSPGGRVAHIGCRLRFGANDRGAGPAWLQAGRLRHRTRYARAYTPKGGAGGDLGPSICRSRRRSPTTIHRRVLSRCNRHGRNSVSTLASGGNP